MARAYAHFDFTEIEKLTRSWLARLLNAQPLFLTYITLFVVQAPQQPLNYVASKRMRSEINKRTDN